MNSSRREESLDYNRSGLVGRLVKNPEYFPAGKRGQEHCTFTVVCNRVVPSEKGPEADFILCSLWGPEAREMVERAHKGDELTCIGRIRTAFVAQGDGSRKFFQEVRIDTIRYGAIALKNLRKQQEQDPTVQAVNQLMEEFGGE
jgi:single-stranded DNA-binding protein